MSFEGILGCCDCGDCNTALTVCVYCGAGGTGPQSGVAVSASVGGVLQDSCTTDVTGCCTLNLTSSAAHEVAVEGVVRTVTPNCGTLGVDIQGAACQSCIDGGPSSLTLTNSYGSVTLSRQAGPPVTYRGSQAIPSVPNVSLIDCASTGNGCGTLVATRDIAVQYVLRCVGGNVQLELLVLQCARCSDGVKRLAKCESTDNTPISPCPGFPAVANAAFTLDFGDTDSIGYGACVPCGEDLEFALDYSGVNGTAELVTVSGL